MTTSNNMKIGWYIIVMSISTYGSMRDF